MAPLTKRIWPTLTCQQWEGTSCPVKRGRFNPMIWRYLIPFLTPRAPTVEPGICRERLHGQGTPQIETKPSNPAVASRPPSGRKAALFTLPTCCKT